MLAWIYECQNFTFYFYKIEVTYIINESAKTALTKILKSFHLDQTKLEYKEKEFMSQNFSRLTFQHLFVTKNCQN